jgi:putative ABC transport system ATP-binding protein
MIHASAQPRAGAVPVVSPAPDRQPVVQLVDVSRTFEGDSPVHALRDVNLTIWSGDWLAIVGPSGSGKSTLLNVIGLLDRHTAGIYRFGGIDVAELDDLRRAGLRGRRIGFVFQAFHLLPHRSVMENVMLAELYVGAPRRGRRERARAALERVGLGGRADFLPTRRAATGGDRQGAHGSSEPPPVRRANRESGLAQRGRGARHLRAALG